MCVEQLGTKIVSGNCARASGSHAAHWGTPNENNGLCSWWFFFWDRYQFSGAEASYTVILFGSLWIVNRVCCRTVSLSLSRDLGENALPTPSKRRFFVYKSQPSAPLLSLSLGIFIFANCPPLALLLLLGVDWSRVPMSNVAPSPFPSTHTHTHKIQTAALLFRKHAYFHHGVYENGAAREEIFCKIKL